MKTAKFIEEVRKESHTYGSIPFWSWNDKLDEAELRRQIGRMDELGMHGFFMHARGGLETEYLSEDWFNCVKACTDEAKKRGMEAWSYDENGWPSGFAGGELLKDSKNYAHFLTIRTSDTFPQDALAVFVRSGEGYRYVTAAEEGVGEYEIIEVGTDVSYVDTFDGDITAEFIKETHKRYKDELDKKDFGKSMPGFFTDEPQYYRYATPWSNTFPRRFKEMFGGEVKEGLIALFRKFPGCEEFRYDYHLMMHRLFINNFIRPIYEWCEENGCRLTGHGVEESTLYGQMWCCGGIMPFYQYEHIPGMDYLGRALSNDVAPKQLGSACAQTGRKKVLSEMFACCGWDVSPAELKRIAELQYVNGVNIMCQHLYAYSLRGQRKRDYPANYSEHLPWQDNMKEFNNYFNHLGYMLSRGEEEAKVLVIHPIRSCYLTYNRAEDYQSVKDIEDSFGALSDLLSQNQIAYHYGDETMLAEMGSVRKDSIKLGRCKYSCVVIPKTYTIDKNTAEMLKKYIENGGKIWLYDKAPDRIDGRKADLTFLRSNITFDDIKKENAVSISFPGGDIKPLRTMVRNTSKGRIIHIANISDRTFDGLKVSVKNVSNLAGLDIDTLETYSVPCVKTSEGVEVTLNLEDSEGITLLETNDKPKAFKAPKGKEFTLEGPFAFAKKPCNTFIIDKAMISKDGGATFGPEMPVMAVKDILLREKYQGKLVIKYVFNIDCIPDNLEVVWEPIKGSETFVNGTKIAASDKHWPDKGFNVSEISSLLVQGKNEVTLSFDYFQRDYVYYVLYGGVSESLRNCLWFDTEIECIMLRGDFAVRLDEGNAIPEQGISMIYNGTTFTLTKQKETINLFDTVNDGYTFFSGKMAVKTDFIHGEGDGTLLSLPGRFASCEVEINGNKAGTMLFTHKMDLSKYIKQGKNEITLTFTASNRNLLGPHHNKTAEVFWVSPTTFTCEKTFNEEGKSPDYVEGRYTFVRFGLIK